MEYVRKEIWLHPDVIKILEEKANKVKVEKGRCSVKRYMEMVIVNDSKVKKVIQK